MDWLRRLPQAPVTSGLLFFNVLVFVLMAALSGHWLQFDQNTLVLSGANVVLDPGSTAAVSPLRNLTAAFIHVSLLHILMNMAFLVQLGVLSERFVGGGLLAGGYVVTGVIGNLVSSGWAHLHGARLLSAGASGGLMGLLGMVAVLAWMADLKPLAKALFRNAMFVIGLGLALSWSGTSLVATLASFAMVISRRGAS